MFNYISRNGLADIQVDIKMITITLNNKLNQTNDVIPKYQMINTYIGLNDNRSITDSLKQGNVEITDSAETYWIYPTSNVSYLHDTAAVGQTRCFH